MKKLDIYILIFGLIIPVILSFFTSQYRYKRCVKINSEEFIKCQASEFGDYECSVFENAEDLCRI